MERRDRDWFFCQIVRQGPRVIFENTLWLGGSSIRRVRTSFEVPSTSEEDVAKTRWEGYELPLQMATNASYVIRIQLFLGYNRQTWRAGNGTDLAVPHPQPNLSENGMPSLLYYPRERFGASKECHFASAAQHQFN